MIKTLLLSLLLAFPCRATIALVQVNTAATGGGNTTVTTTFGSTPTVGNLVVVGCAATTGSNVINTPTDNQGGGNTYTQAVTIANNPRVSIYYSIVAVASGTFSITCTTTMGSFITNIILEYSGVNSSTPLDQTATGTSNATSATSGTINTTKANEVIVGVYSNRASGTLSFTPDTGFATRASVTNGTANEAGAVEDDIVSATVSRTVSMTANTAGPSSISVATFVDATQPTVLSVPHPIIIE